MKEQSDAVKRGQRILALNDQLRSVTGLGVSEYGGIRIEVNLQGELAGIEFTAQALMLHPDQLGDEVMAVFQRALSDRNAKILGTANAAKNDPLISDYAARIEQSVGGFLSER